MSVAQAKITAKSKSALESTITWIVLDSFYLLIFYSEKFSTWIWRLPFGIEVNLNLPSSTKWVATLYVRESFKNCEPTFVECMAPCIVWFKILLLLPTFVGSCEDSQVARCFNVFHQHFSVSMGAKWLQIVGLMVVTPLLLNIILTLLEDLV